ncbi:ABC transporter permease [Cupriavidus basilensis]|uniref:ABC transporter permease n=1 Tax=Cupriavidus basilensis TaxID=68895 RepID=UPI00284D4A7B|nr:ABC transporter permease [Cupriavidus basilensis]MDR3381249.1 ABC transporter permease [Cupriavidus basilensis]
MSAPTQPAAAVNGSRPSSAVPRANVWQRLAQHRQNLVLPFLFAGSVLVFAAFAPGFCTLDNVTNIARQSVYLMIVALAQMVVLIGGGLDLSVGTVVALASVAGATAMSATAQAFPDIPVLAMAAGVAAGVACGAVVGLLNGVGTAVLRIPAFMMTLGMSSVVFGVALLVSGGVPIYGLPPQFGEIFGFGRLAGVPVPVLIAVAMVLLTYFLLEWTRFGRHLYAVGGNQRAAELSGVRTRRVVIVAFTLAGALSALAGLLLTARLDTGESNIGATLPLESIAACVIAGVALTGGIGRTLAVAVGTLLIVLVQNGMNLMQVGAYAQTMVIGAILIVSMALARR